MSTKIAGAIAITLSLSSMVLVLLFVPFMIGKMSNIHGKLQVSMEEFSVSDYSYVQLFLTTCNHL